MTKKTVTTNDRKKFFVRAINQALAVGECSQRTLCTRLDITIGTLNKYRREMVDPFDVKTRITRALARNLGVTTESLYNYFDTGVYGDQVDVEVVSSWIRSDAGMSDLPKILESLAANKIAFDDSGKQLKSSTLAPKEVKKTITDEGATAFMECCDSFYENYRTEQHLTKEQAAKEIIPLMQDIVEVEYMSSLINYFLGKASPEKVSGEYTTAAYKAHGYTCPFIKTMQAWTGRDCNELVASLDSVLT